MIINFRQLAENQPFHAQLRPGLLYRSGDCSRASAVEHLTRGYEDFIGALRRLGASIEQVF